jgi:hypothetical protein
MKLEFCFLPEMERKDVWDQRQAGPCSARDFPTAESNSFQYLPSLAPFLERFYNVRIIWNFPLLSVVK